MAEEPTPIAYTALSSGVPVRCADGTVFGSVVKVLAVPEEDLFDGLVVSTANGERFVDADEVAQITTMYVRTTLTPAQSGALPKPAGVPAFDVDPGQGVGRSLRDVVDRWFRRGRWRQDE
ncbi:MAG TPA: hypothetical protein VFI30_06450 [Nocardioidaceae bacterium]|nr:hypothetical protein [Nocardioidaceae bacterium]